MADSDPEDLFASPSAQAARQKSLPERPKTPKTPTGDPPQPQPQRVPEPTTEDRDAVLQRELEGVRNINELIEGVLGTLDRAKGNMGTVSKTVNTASTLLNTWTRILSQTEHNQRLILNPTWKGASQDLQDMENEAAQRQMMAERRAAEEERRRGETTRRREEQERQREAASSTRGTTVRGTRGTRGRVARATTRGTARGGLTSLTSHNRDQTSSGIPSSRTTSGSGRGFLRGGSRGPRARGGTERGA